MAHQMSSTNFETGFRYDLDRAESHVYSGQKSMNLLQKLTELRHFQTLTASKTLEAEKTAISVYRISKIWSKHSFIMPANVWF